MPFKFNPITATLDLVQPAITEDVQVELNGKVSKSGDTMTGVLEVNRNNPSNTTNIEFNNTHAGGRADVTWISDLGDPISKMSAHTSDDPSSDQTHWQVYTYKADKTTAHSVLAIQSHTNTPIGTFNNLSKLQVASTGTGIASRLYLTRQAADGSPDETNMMAFEKRSTSGSQLQDIASTGNALFDIDPVPQDGSSTASMRMFRNTNTTGTRSFSIYRGDGTSTLQHFFNAAGSSYVCANTGNFGIGVSSGINSRLQVNGSFATAITTVSANTTLDATHHTVGVDASGGNRTINLPAASGCSGRIYIVKKVDSTANTVTIDANGSETIDGDLTRVLSSQWSYLTIQSTGSSWYII